MKLLHLNAHQADAPRLGVPAESAIQAGYPASLYAAQAKPLLCPTAQGQLACDVAIIGAGYTGLNAALTLAERGLKVMVLEAKALGWGASGRNGGQVNIGQNSDPEQLVKLCGVHDGRLLWQFGLDAVRLVRKRLQECQVDAKLKEGIAYLDRSLKDQDHNARMVDFVQKHYDYERMSLIAPDQVQEFVASDYYSCGLHYQEGCHIDPLAYVLALGRRALALGVSVYENSEVTSFGADYVNTKQAQIRARHVLVASNGYSGDLAQRYANYVMPINSYIIATEPIKDAAKLLMPKDNAVADDKFVVNYFRIQDERLVFGGRESYGLRFTKNIAEKVRPRMVAIFPQLKEAQIDYAWGGSLGITRTRLPYFARDKQGIFIAAGFSGHGVAMASLGGVMAAQAILADTEHFDVMARIPQQRFYGGTWLRQPLLFAAMTWFSLRDRLGF